MYFRKEGFKSYICFGVICKVLRKQCKCTQFGVKRVSFVTLHFPESKQHFSNNFDAINILGKTEWLSGIKQPEFAYSIVLMMRIYISFLLSDKLVCWARLVILSCHKGNLSVKWSQHVGTVSTGCNRKLHWDQF